MPDHTPPAIPAPSAEDLACDLAAEYESLPKILVTVTFPPESSSRAATYASFPAHGSGWAVAIRRAAHAEARVRELERELGEASNVCDRCGKALTEASPYIRPAVSTDPGAS